MQKLTIIKIAECPYCNNALRALASLRAEQPEYNLVDIELIDENEEVVKTKQYAGYYYYVPSIFIEKKKLYEAKPGDDYDTIRDEIAEALKKALCG